MDRAQDLPEERDNVRDLRPRAPAVPAGVKIAVVVVLLVIAGVTGVFVWNQDQPSILPQPTARAPAPAAPTGPAHPLAAAPDEKPLPALDASDAPIREALVTAAGPTAVERLLFEGFIRNVVATIDNLPREHYAARLNPVKPAAGLPKTSGHGEQLVLAADNAQRYAPAMKAFEAVDAGAVADVYKRYYPLFQQAYVELGYPQGYFNDRLVEVIDHLLATPEVKGPIRLVQPKVLYEFADPALEERSAGQKALLRLGSANEARVKAKLMEIRAKVAQ